MSRWKAAAIHLSISAAIGLVAAILIFGVWYPPPYSRATGALELVALLLGVDLVLGPLLTLIVFKSGKKSLKFDLGAIALLQTCAFVYGMSVVTRARPAFVVATIDRFELISAKDLDPRDLAQGSKPEFRSLSWTGPRVVGTALPTDNRERLDVLFGGAGGRDIDVLPKYYKGYEEVAPDLLKRANTLPLLLQKHPESAPMIDAWLRQRKLAASGIVWVPLASGRMDLVVLLDSTSGAVLDMLPIDPW